MSMSIVYVYPVNCGVNYERYALRFVQTYQQFKPQVDHETIVVLNNGSPNSELLCLFSSLPNLRFLQHDNSGHDIGAFQKAALTCSSDMIVFFGSSTYFRRQTWLERMADAFVRHGPAIYGAMGNNGNISVGGGVYPHIRTTAFWLPPKFMNMYPKRVTCPAERYPFEHGPECLTSWASQQRIQSFEITASMDLVLGQWGMDPNGYHRGDQGSLLVGDRMTEPPFYPIP